jgi:hypothetical protein
MPLSRRRHSGSGIRIWIGQCPRLRIEGYEAARCRRLYAVSPRLRSEAVDLHVDVQDFPAGVSDHWAAAPWQFDLLRRLLREVWIAVESSNVAHASASLAGCGPSQMARSIDIGVSSPSASEPERHDNPFELASALRRHERALAQARISVLDPRVASLSALAGARRAPKSCSYTRGSGEAQATVS